MTINEFETFYRDNYGAISRYVGRRVAPNAHDDVVAATFVVAWQKFSSAPDPSRAWLFRIAGYEIKHELRNAQRSPHLIEFNDLALVDSHAVEYVFDVETAFNELSDADAELLRLVHWDQFSRSEIAEILGCSVTAVNVRYHRASARFASTLHRLTGASNDVPAKPKENK